MDAGGYILALLRYGVEFFRLGEATLTRLNRAARLPAWLLGAALLPILVLAVACGGEPLPPSSQATPAGTAPSTAPPAGATKAPPGPTAVPTLTGAYTLSLATSGTAESYYGFGKALAALWSANLPSVRVVPSTAGASVAALRSLGANQIDMALAQSDIADYAFNGTEMFGNKIANLRAVAVLYPQMVQWVMDPDIIYTIEGIKGAQLAVGPAGSGSEANTRQILDANGVAYKDLVKALFLSSSEAVDAFDFGQIHGFCLTDGLPSPAVTEATDTRKIRMLPITGEAAQKVMARYKKFTPGTIPAGTYKGLAEAVPTLSVRAVLVVRQELDESLVYWLAKTLLEKQPDLAKAHPLGKELTRGTIAADVPIPLHPGAERYYKETGVLK